MTYKNTYKDGLQNPGNWEFDLAGHMQTLFVCPLHEIGWKTVLLDFYFFLKKVHSVIHLLGLHCMLVNLFTYAMVEM